MSVPNLVSAILPAKNAANTINETIRSIQNQVYKNWELVIVVAPSQDDTENLALKAAEYDKRIKVLIDAKSEGIAEACNLAIENCAGEYIAICNSDDINMPNRFLAQSRFLANNPEIGVIGSNVQTFGKSYSYWSLPKEHEVIAATMLFRGSIANPAAMIRSEVLKKNSIEYDKRFNKGSEDLDLWERLSNVTYMANLNYSLIKYRISDSQLSVTTSKTSLENAREVRRRILNHVGIMKFDEFEFIHNQIADNELGIDYEKADYWFKQIEIANLKTLHFEPNALKSILERKISNIRT